jgi:hypothetical protein
MWSLCSLFFVYLFSENASLLEELSAGEQVSETERGAVAKAVPQLGVPAVDQELHLHVVQHV